MTALFLESFLKDVQKLRDAKVQRGIAAAIQNVEKAAKLSDVRSLKRLSC